VTSDYPSGTSREKNLNVVYVDIARQTNGLHGENLAVESRNGSFEAPDIVSAAIQML
jgi:hypothetical protein